MSTHSPHDTSRAGDGGYTMQELADELVESWINGNRKDAISTVINQPSAARGALLGALVATQLDAEDRDTFLRMLEGRI